MKGGLTLGSEAALQDLPTPRFGQLFAGNGG